MKLKGFNPINHAYAFRLNGYCYALKSSGVCSLKLTPAQAEEEYKKETTRFKEESVLYCRKLADFLIEKDYYNNSSKDPFPISIYENNQCGHYTFNDGQHRTCIAKHLNIEYIEVDYQINENGICSVCSIRRSEKEKNKHKWYEKLKFFKKKETPRTIIDDEYLYK